MLRFSSCPPPPPPSFSSSVLLGFLFVALASAATPFVHSWDTVGDVMAMHGKYKDAPTAADVAFVAQHYATVTTGTACSDTVNTTHTIEQSVLAVAAQIKAANPAVKMGMYWRSDFALELADCSGFAGEWAAHPEWRLRDDSGRLVGSKGHYYIDYSNPAAAAFFARVLVNVTRAVLPSGAPVLDFVYIDGDPGQSDTTQIHPDISANRSLALVNAIYGCFGDIQRQLDAAGHGQKIILNGMDTAWSAARHVATGAAGSMFDHWSILQFVNRTDGVFNATMMDQAFALVAHNLTNVTTQIKGWPGPIVRQRDQYPPNMPTPATPAQMQQLAAERFNSELALFLLVASEFDYWIYSAFWGFDDFVPGHPDSTVPATFFPQARCPLGPPAGPYTRRPGTWTYTRDFAHAHVFVDLTNRTASRVDFAAC